MLLTLQFICRKQCQTYSDTVLGVEETVKLSLFELLADIRRVRSIEKYIALKNNKLKKHELKWRESLHEKDSDENLDRFCN